jgi:RNA polymerase sigma-70 factor (ECF subfamily)
VRADHARLVRVVAVVAPSVADAEDAVQEAFARAWERQARGQTIDDLPAWIVTVALNLVRSRFRRLRRISASHADPAGPSGGGLDEELIDLRDAVRALPARQAQCVVLHYLLGFEVRVIATTLRVSEGTVKTALTRARASLAASLSEVNLDA